MHEGPVGADDPVVAELLAQETGEDLLVEAETDLLHRFAVEHEPLGEAVVGHDARRARGNCGAEGLEVVIEVVARVDLLPPVGEVRVLAVLLGAAPGEVLGGAGDRCRAQLGALEPVEVGAHVGGCELGILAERVDLPRPARLGREVDGGVERGADADGGVLGARDVGELPDRVDVAECGEAQGLRPLREERGGERGADVADERVPRIGGEGDGDAESRARRCLLQGVAPGHGLFDAFELEHVEVRHVLLAEQVAGRRLVVALGTDDVIVGGLVLDDDSAASGLDDRLEHLPGLLGQRHPRQQVVDAVVDARGRVLVDRHDAVVVEVAETRSVGCGERRGGGGQRVGHGGLLSGLH
ncbi:hypothetical protein QE454_001448 [Microbacterium sp. SORGH_AS454]|nr:hypothetical protein [Microbacterium sp. SORGH_AS_0454]